MSKFCSQCGQEVNENAVVCTKCGCALASPPKVLDDNPSMGLNILSLLIPLVGLILFCVYFQTKPESAKSYGLWALIGLCASFLLTSCVAMF